MSTELATYEDYKNESYLVLDVFSDKLNKHGLRFSPQAGGRELGIWKYDTDTPFGTDIYIQDESVDDLITYLEYYKHKKMEKGTWKND